MKGDKQARPLQEKQEWISGRDVSKGLQVNLGFTLYLAKGKIWKVNGRQKIHSQKNG